MGMILFLCGIACCTLIFLVYKSRTSRSEDTKADTTTYTVTDTTTRTITDTTMDTVKTGKELVYGKGFLKEQNSKKEQQPEYEIVDVYIYKKGKAAWICNNCGAENQKIYDKCHVCNTGK